MRLSCTVALQIRDKKTVTSDGRCTDVLVRDGRDWKSISGRGGDERDQP